MATLEWAIKESLITYVRTDAGGTVTPTGGTSERDGVFIFPEGGDDRSFTGAVELYAHGGMMSVSLGGIRIDESEGVSVSIADEGTKGGRAHIATAGALVAGPGGSMRTEGLKMTALGAALFSGPYMGGTPLAELTIRP